MKKKLLVAILATITALCNLLGFTACDLSNSDNNQTGNSQGAEQPNETTGTTNSNLSQYSQILQTVLTDSHYTNLINEYFGSYNYEGPENKHTSIPYAFLEKQGHDINSIKTDQLKCITDAYIKNDNKNELYVTVRVENKNNLGNYYTNYVLSYNLTEKEYNDLYMLHKGRYREASYFIQELSKVKIPTVKSSVNIDIETYDNLDMGFSNSTFLKENFDNNHLDLDIIKVSDKNNFTMALRTTPSYKDMVSTNCIIRNLSIKVSNVSSPIYSDGIYGIKYSHDLTFEFSNLSEFEKNYDLITYFSTQGLNNINLNYSDKLK